MGFLKDFVQRRRLRPVIVKLPYFLKQHYGSAAFYTANQVKTAANTLKLHAEVLPSALAVACSLDEFLKADPHLTETDYLAKRRDIARLFAIDKPEFNCRSLTKKFRPSGVENPAEPSILIDPNITHHGGGGN
jgi:hypothetical protein